MTESRNCPENDRVQTHASLEDLLRRRGLLAASCCLVKPRSFSPIEQTQRHTHTNFPRGSAAAERERQQSFAVRLPQEPAARGDRHTHTLAFRRGSTAAERERDTVSSRSRSPYEALREDTRLFHCEQDRRQRARRRGLLL